MIMASAPSTPKAGWEDKKLSEIFDVRSSKRVHKSDWRSEGIPFYRAREIVVLSKTGEVDNDLFISRELFNEFTSKNGAPKPGDLILSAVGTLGKCYLVQPTDEFYFKDASVLWLKKTSDVNSRFVEYAFQSDLVIDQVMANSMGATVGTYTISRAKNTIIPFPPLPEQERIVGILDEAFEGIAAATAQAEKNLHNARELFQSVLQSTFSQKGDDWEETTLGEAYNFKNGINFNKHQKGEEGTLTLDVLNMYTDSTVVNTGELYRVNKEIKDDYLLKRGDILFVRSSVKREGVGWPAGFQELPESVTYCGFIIRARLAESFEINPEYAVYYLRQEEMRESVVSKAKQATITNINQEILSQVKISLPPLPTQQAIVEKLDALSEETKALEAIYERKQSALAELKQSLLQKAFAGEL